MQICYTPVSKIESETWVLVASRGMGEKKTGNSMYGEHVWRKIKWEKPWQDKVTSSKQKEQITLLLEVDLYMWWQSVKVKVNTDIAVRNRNYHTVTRNRMPYGITQCYLPPIRGDFSAFTPAEAGTRFSDSGWMQGWVWIIFCFWLQEILMP